MGTGGALSGRDPPARAAVLLHESARTRVTRVSLPAGTVVCKEPLGPDISFFRRSRDQEI
jgi:hypothetical protein